MGAEPHFSAEINSRLDTLRELPLFAGLDSAALAALFSQAQIVCYERGGVVFMHGERANRYYVVVEGWIKLLKGNVEGDESVLEVLTTGDGLSEAVIFRNATYPVTAQAVERAILLSMPASVVRQRIREDQALALNLLAAAANRSKTLISQFEQLTLKTVTQRVGRFLLKRFLETGHDQQKLELPFEKSVIASYLGMKPETFSRTLQSLRAQGIQIEKNIVTLPDVFALCDYCDMQLAERCPRHNTAECPNPDCADS